MCRLLVYQGEPDFIANQIFSGDHSFVSQSSCATKSITQVNGDGFGIGWYHDRPEPGRFRDVLPAWADENLHNISQQIRSRLLFAHIRASTDTATARNNCHPFMHRQWLFMHNGQIGDFHRIRRPVEALIADEDYHGRCGGTDSEAIFLALFAHGLEADPIAAHQSLFRKIAQIMQAHAINLPFRYTAAMTNGQSVWVIRYASDDAPPTLFYRQEKGNLLVSSEPVQTQQIDPLSCCWKPVAVNHVLVHQQHNLRIEPFKVD